MTRRKRTPSPPPVASARFNIPQSLQQLSALSASLARSADAPVERMNSEIVAAAQGLVVRGVAGGGGEIGSGIAKGQRKGKGRKELKWKTKEHVFPQEQTWLKPVGRSRRAGLEHATSMGSNSLVGRLDGSGGGEDRGGAAVVGEAVGTVQVQTQSQQPLPLPPPRLPPPPLNGSTLQVKMDHRVQQSRSMAPITAMTVGEPDELAANQSGPRKKRRTVEFTERHQREFPTDQTWLRAQPSRGGKPMPSFSSEIEARRAAIIAQLRRTHNPLEIIGAGDVEEERAAAAATGTTTNGGGGTVVGGSVGSVGPSNGLGPAQGISSDAKTDRQHIEALIARKRAENAANGQSWKLLGLKNEHQRKMLEKGMGNSLSGPWDPYPPVGPQLLNRQLLYGHGQGPWLAPRGQAPQGQGQMQVQRPQQATARRQAGRQTLQGGDRAVWAGRRLPTSMSTNSDSNSTVAPGVGVVPLQGLAEAARAVMDSEGGVGGGGSAAAIGGAVGAADGDDTDEDAPGEDDMPEQAVHHTSGAGAIGEAGTVVQSVEGPAADTGTGTSAGAGTALPTRLVDPGDLRSLFSSPGPSSRAASVPFSGQVPVPVEVGRIGNIESVGSGPDGYGDGGGAGIQGEGEGEPDEEGEEDSQRQPSPSAQLLLGLANATSPPQPRLPAAAAAAVGRGRGRGVGQGVGRGPAMKRGAGQHRRTRSGLVLKGK